MGKNHRCIPMCDVEWAPKLCAFVEFCEKNNIDSETMIQYAAIWEEVEMMCTDHMDAFDARQRQWIEELRKKSWTDQRRLQESAGSMDTGILSAVGMKRMEIANFLANRSFAAVKPKAKECMENNHDDATSSTIDAQGVDGHVGGIDDDAADDDGVMLGADNSTLHTASGFGGGDAKRDAAAADGIGILAPDDDKVVSLGDEKFDGDGDADNASDDDASDDDDDAATYVYESCCSDLANMADVSEDASVRMSGGDAAVDDSDAALMADTEATAVAVAEAVLTEDSDNIPAGIVSDADAAEEEGWLGFDEKACGMAEAAIKRDVTAAVAAAVFADQGDAKLIAFDDARKEDDTGASSSEDAVAASQSNEVDGGAAAEDSSDDDCVIVGHRPAYTRVRPASPCCEWERRMNLEIEHVNAMEKYKLRRRASDDAAVTAEAPAKRMKLERKKVTDEVKAVLHQLSRVEESDKVMVDAMIKFVEAMKKIWAAQRAGIVIEECDHTCIDYELP